MEKGQSIRYQLAGHKTKLISIFYIFDILCIYIFFLGILFGEFGITSIQQYMKEK